MLESINPYNQEKIFQVEEAKAGKIGEMIRMADRAFHSWKKVPFNERSVLMRNAARVLKENSHKLGEIITGEMGKPIGESIAEIEKCAWVCEYYASHAIEFLKDEMIDTDAERSFVRYEPIGVVLAVMPWNFPFWQVFRFAAPALMAGNTAVLKHASNTQMSAQEIGKVFSDSGFPEGVFQNIPVSSSGVEGIIANPLVKAVTLTGSEAAGSAVASQAGERIKKTVLELGGSNAFIILEDADFDRAVETGLKARTQNGGQSCIAAKRFLVKDTLMNTFMETMKEKIEEMKAGDPMDRDTDIGPLSSIAQAEEVERQVGESVRAGARIVTGGTRKEAFFEPTLMTGIKRDMPVWKEEVFGPVMPVMSFSSTEEAMEIANDSTFGLGATVFTRGNGNMEKIIPMIGDGSVFFNELVKSDPRLPFGGTRRSGYGRELSYHGIREFVNVKTVFIQK